MYSPPPDLYIIYYNWLLPFQHSQTLPLKRINICSSLFLSVCIDVFDSVWIPHLLKFLWFTAVLIFSFFSLLVGFQLRFSNKDYYDSFRHYLIFGCVLWFLQIYSVLHYYKKKHWTKLLDSDCHCILSRFIFVSFIFLYLK